MSNIKHVQQRFFDEVWNEGRLHTAYALMAPGVTIRSLGRQLSGLEGAAEMVAGLRRAFPDLRVAIGEQFAEFDSVVARWTATGTHRGHFLGFAPTERAIEIEGHTVDRIVGGQIVSTRTIVDIMEILLQLGLEPRFDLRKAVTQRLFAEVWSSGRYAVLDEIVAPDAIVGARGHRGPAAVRAFVKAYRDAIPDLRMEVREQVAEGDAVASAWILRGTHRGTLMGIPPTGRRVEFTGSSIEHLANGKITRSAMVFDILEMLSQLGGLVGVGK